MCMNIKTSLQQSQKWLVTLLLLAGSITSYAQSECFEYDVTDETIITGLTETGQAATSLTIPKEVTVVNSGAFTQATSLLTSLYVENGGNPAFESGLFGKNANTLTRIEMGDFMSVANMIALLQSVGTFNAGTTIVADGFSGIRDNTDETWDDVTWTNVASITLPAQLIADQEFGDAQVYGRFTINKEIISFCTTANFFDEDDGSNMLFYIADKIADDGRLHIQRVRCVAYGEGVLIHNLEKTSASADLLRVSSVPTAQLELYSTNMLKGVTEQTYIYKTEDEGNKTNLVLKDGAFHPLTKDGTIGANKAYLQVSTSMLAREVLIISFDEETNGVKEVNGVKDVNDDSYFDLQGRKVTQPTKGLYIMNGKKYVIR